MPYIQNQSQTKLDIQTIGVEMNDYLERKVQNMIKKMRKILPDINWVDVYLKKNEETGKPRTVVVRFGIPGPDIIASDSGTQ